MASTQGGRFGAIRGGASASINQREKDHHCPAALPVGVKIGLPNRHRPTVVKEISIRPENRVVRGNPFASPANSSTETAVQGQRAPSFWFEPVTQGYAVDRRPMMLLPARLLPNRGGEGLPDQRGCDFKDGEWRMRHGGDSGRRRHGFACGEQIEVEGSGRVAVRRSGGGEEMAYSISCTTADGYEVFGGGIKELSTSNTSTKGLKELSVASFDVERRATVAPTFVQPEAGPSCELTHLLPRFCSLWRQKKQSMISNLNTDHHCPAAPPVAVKIGLHNWHRSTMTITMKRIMAL
ncbi:hypothetical protein EJB05_49872, partial [Eragrostis curvula]